MTETEAMTYLEADPGRVPCSPYGFDSISCAPVAYAAARVLEAETGEPMTLDGLDYMMGLVVNGHPDPGYLIANYGPTIGIIPGDLLDDPDTYMEE